MRWPDGSYYKGEFKGNKKQGHGVFTFADGSMYDGPWEDDKKQGRGTFTWDDGMKFVGNFFEGEHKDGVLTTKDGLER